MLKSCTKRNSDDSDESIFRFSFYCDVCGEPYSSAPVEFATCKSLCSQSPQPAPEDSQWRLLWRGEHVKAFQRANFEASHHFFSCPGCGLYVCKKCTAAKTEDDGSVRLVRCVNCERRINQGTLKSRLRFVYEPQSTAAHPTGKGGGVYAGSETPERNPQDRR